MDEHDGIQILLTLLRSLLSNTEEGADKLRTIACGFLLNLTNTHGKKVFIALLWANSAKVLFIIFFLFFPENKICY